MWIDNARCKPNPTVTHGFQVFDAESANALCSFHVLPFQFKIYQSCDETWMLTLAPWTLSACFSSFTKLFARFRPALGTFGWSADCSAPLTEPAGAGGCAPFAMGAFGAGGGAGPAAGALVGAGDAARSGPAAALPDELALGPALNPCGPAGALGAGAEAVPDACPAGAVATGGAAG